MRAAYRKRRIFQPPHFQHFKPVGIPRRLLQSISLTVDEYEAVRLADYQGLEHVKAAEEMAISRPTFTRLVEKARHKIAQAIVDGMELVVEGGNVEFTNTLRRCRDCGEERVIPVDEQITDCTECGSENVEDFMYQYIHDDRRHGRRGHQGNRDKGGRG